MATVRALMSNRADENSRVLGGIVCLAALLALVLFMYGLSVQSYWAVAIPVAALFVFVLGLVFWVGWTIMTVRVEPSGEPLVPPGGPSAASTPDPAPREESHTSEEA